MRKQVGVSWRGCSLSLTIGTGFKHQFQRVPIGECDFQKIAIKPSSLGAHSFHGNGLPDGLCKIVSAKCDASEPGGWVALELPILHAAVISLRVHINDNMGIEPVDFC